MGTLLLRLAGPMQSWGTTSRFDERDSQLEPSKSGVIGLICAALGRDRATPIDDLAEMRMGVRVDREGVLMRDYHTATGVMTAAGEVVPSRTVVSRRYYLADASFLVGMEGGEPGLLLQVQDALRSPVWPLFLGRKAFPPGNPVWLDDGLSDQGLRDVLVGYPRIAQPQYEQKNERLRLLLEHPSEGVMRLDNPVAPFSERRFGPRYVVSELIDVPF